MSTLRGRHPSPPISIDSSKLEPTLITTGKKKRKKESKTFYLLKYSIQSTWNGKIIQNTLISMAREPSHASSIKQNGGLESGVRDYDSVAEKSDSEPQKQASIARSKSRIVVTRSSQQVPNRKERQIASRPPPGFDLASASSYLYSKMRNVPVPFDQEGGEWSYIPYKRIPKHRRD